MTESYQDAPSTTVDVDGIPFTYRQVGTEGGVPLVLLHHLTAVLDDWDPAVVDGLAAERHVIAFDNRGVGGSAGTTPDNIQAMADDAVAFLEALGLDTVDLLGFSLGGMVAQVVAQQRSDLVRRLILAGTGPAGGKGRASCAEMLQIAIQQAPTEGRHPNPKPGRSTRLGTHRRTESVSPATHNRPMWTRDASLLRAGRIRRRPMTRPRRR
jgi:pimeloyl-ACP methyl ester carboxylesterase